MINLITMKQSPKGSGYNRSLNLAKCSGLMTVLLLSTFSSLKVSQLMLGGSQMSGFQNQVDSSDSSLPMPDIFL